jgi:hypothetical protein
MEVVMVTKERNSMVLVLNSLGVLSYVVAVIPVIYLAWKMMLMLFGISEMKHPFLGTFGLIYSTLCWAVVWGLAGFSFRTVAFFKRPIF